MRDNKRSRWDAARDAFAAKKGPEPRPWRKYRLDGVLFEPAQSAAPESRVRGEDLGRDVLERTNAAIKRMSPSEFAASLRDAGITDAEGKLTALYRGGGPDGPGDMPATGADRMYDDARRRSRLCAVANDIHWPAVRAGCWNGFREWHHEWRPAVTCINGDALDFEPISSHAKGTNTPTEIASSIETFVGEMNILASECGKLVIQPGNHERRLARYLGGASPFVLKGLKGLTLHEICLAHGLRRDIEWHEESTRYQGFRFADFLIRHGDGQASRFGGGANPAQTQLRRSFGQSIAFGHTHRAGITTATAGGRTYFGVANGCLADDADYAPDPAWERSFLVLEALAPDYEHATPTLVVFQGTRFSYAGKTYGIARAA